MIFPTGNGRHRIAPVAASACGLLMAELLKTNGRAVFVAKDDRGMERLKEQIGFFLPDVPCFSFPAWDCMPYDRMSPHSFIVAERIKALSQLKDGFEKGILLTSINALLQRVPVREHIKSACFDIKAGKALNQDSLIKFLIDNGYQRIGKVMETGEFAVRGGIIDIFPPGEDKAIRIDCFGDEVENIRYFDPISQASAENTSQISLIAAGEVAFDDDAIACFRRKFRERFGASMNHPLYVSISEKRKYPGFEHWLPLFYEQTATLFDYIPPGTAIVLEHMAEQAETERHELISECYDNRVKFDKGETAYNPLPTNELYLSAAEFSSNMGSHSVFSLSPLNEAGAITTEWNAHPGFSAARNISGAHVMDAVIAEIGEHHRSNRKVIIAAASNGSLDRIRHMLHSKALIEVSHWYEICPSQLENCDGHMKIVPGRDDFPPRSERNEELAKANSSTGKAVSKIPDGAIGLCVLPLEQGIVSPHFAIITETDIFGERILRARPRRKAAELFLEEAANFSEGEIIVHREHGIGQFAGLETVTAGNAPHDCLKLIYRDGDRLFVPVENSEIISRYGSEDENVQLDKLGAGAWQSRKARMKERITIAAEVLLKTAAERATASTNPITAPEGIYDEFCARFPYAETEDQIRAIEDVMNDLATGRPMDRLICGDVGFGKTEVALRAAFLAVQSGFGEERGQVALICPTTLLARQHYRTFKERFAGLPFKIGAISRLISAKERKEFKKGIAEGSVDIMIGTHALLAKDVAFKNLKMIIVDEEQNFGVGQKEKLKQLRANTHVLTLSATPIPRTLQLSLAGIKELSLITTPPVDRLAVRTFVGPYDPVVIREAILREYARGGKIFYVCPRIKDLDKLAAELKQLVPEVKVGIAHGQLPPTTLDQLMNEFYDGKFGILLTTNIIESGLDISSANTIIVHKAHMFGLAQLYQLRGRVGRGKMRAYAYFTLPHGINLNSTAIKRLEVMQTLDTLGAGFTIASHDMDIRGFGNILGDEQTGHIREVGIELYQQMLEDAVQNLKNRGTDEIADDSGWSPQINIGMAVLIPERYIPDLSLRLGLYRRLSRLKSEEEIESFAVEMTDRFGKMPDEFENLLQVMKIKLLCVSAGIEKIDAGPKGIVISFRGNKFSNPVALVDFIGRNSPQVKLRPDHKLVVMREWASDQAKIAGVKESLAGIAKIAA